MNFYTLTSKHKVYLSLILVAISLVFINLIILFFIDGKTTKDSFIGSKFAKTKHYSLNNQTSKDIVFIGDSHTVFHISTNTFKKHGLDVYNLGVAGAHLENFPFHIKYISNANVKPKRIVLTFDIETLYRDLPVSHYPTITEIKLYYEVNKIKFFKSILQWIKSFNVLFQYSEAVFNKVESLYNSFKPVETIINNAQVNNDLVDVDYSNLVGCNVFDIKHQGHAAILKCSNGDGILVGTVVETGVRKNKDLVNINQEVIKYLNSAISLVDESIEVIIVFSPKNVNDNIKYKLSRIKNHIKGAKVIDLTNYLINNDMRADLSHFNNIGREKYSSYLAHMFKQDISQ